MGWSFLERICKRVGIIDIQPWLESRSEAFLHFEGQFSSPDEGLAWFYGKIAFRVYPAGYRVRLEAQVEPFLHYFGEVYLHDGFIRDPEVRHHSLALGGLEVAIRVAVFDGLLAFRELLETVLGVA